MSIEQYLKDKKTIVDNALDSYLPLKTEYPQMIHQAMRYSTEGGKRIRAILTIAACEICGGDNIEDAIRLGCALELIHTYSLVHDDLPAMDNDDFRRGRLSCHKQFGQAAAILTGDALLTSGMELIAKCKNTSRVLKDVCYAIGTYGMIGGQVVDIELKRNQNLHLQDTNILSDKFGENLPVLEYIASHKTGSLIAVSTKIGAITANVSEDCIEHLFKYGQYIGMVFQMVDDILDNDGYASVKSSVEIKTEAENLTLKAKEELISFGDNAQRLNQIADYILCRTF